MANNKNWNVRKTGTRGFDVKSNQAFDKDDLHIAECYVFALINKLPIPNGLIWVHSFTSNSVLPISDVIMQE